MMKPSEKPLSKLRYKFFYHLPSILQLFNQLLSQAPELINAIGFKKGTAITVLFEHGRYGKNVNRRAGNSIFYIKKRIKLGILLAFGPGIGHITGMYYFNSCSSRSLKDPINVNTNNIVVR